MDLLKKILFLVAKLSLILHLIEKGNIIFCWLQCKMVQPIWPVVWKRVLKGLDNIWFTHATSGNLSQGKNSK